METWIVRSGINETKQKAQNSRRDCKGNNYGMIGDLKMLSSTRLNRLIANIKSHASQIISTFLPTYSCLRIWINLIRDLHEWLFRRVDHNFSNFGSDLLDAERLVA